MCGIAGVLLYQEYDADVSGMLHRMASSLSHRGPDDEGYVVFNKMGAVSCGGKDTPDASRKNQFNYSAQRHIDEPVPDAFLGFAHRRLSVIDLTAAGHQPMCNEDASIWITCNGEIYNYIELRSELEQMGIKFRTQTDTEVLLKAYETWDMAFINRLNGMWAFVIYDIRKNVLFGCRDRFGVKPMYYHQEDGLFAFASEQKALLTLPIEKNLNHKAVYDYLVFGQVETDETGFYSHIKELLPSHYFICNLNTSHFEINRYYTLPFNEEYHSFNAKRSLDHIKKTKEKIYSAVNLRLRSDVPVGFCLSGGIDSSSIIGVAKDINQNKHLAQLQDNLHAFTATHGSHECDESEWAKQVVIKNELCWHQAACSSDELFDELETMIWYQDSPLFSTSTYAQNAVMKLAKQHGISILLDGQGGDELFAGYVPFYISFYFELIRKMRFGRLGSEWFNLNNSPLNNSILIKSMGKVLLNTSLSSSLRKTLYKYLHPETDYIPDNLFSQYQSGLSIAPEYSKQSMNRWLHDFFTRYYLKNLLRWEDRCSMQYSIESRTPFSDDTDLIEYVFSIPSSYKIHDGWSKYLLRNAMKEILPKPVYQRTDKLGFATPQTQWLMKQNYKMNRIINDLRHYDSDKLVDSKSLLANWNAIFDASSHKSTQDFVWRYMNYLLWRKVNGIN